jgi:NAD(P)-dependent dehydrogenase (short-subunit alcohol dehydrogenase family)
MKKMLEDRVSLVTGGGGGIGRATALAFAEEGATVVVADVMVEGGEETVRMITEAGGEALFVKTDVSRAGGCGVDDKDGCRYIWPAGLRVQ